MSPTSIPTEPAVEARGLLQAGALRTVRVVRSAEAILLLAASIFLALHAVHLKADFPNGSPWMDWAKYTDEGWYGDAAIRHYDLGHWNVPGDFNPAAALPVWPAIEIVLFRVTGVSLVAARALTVAVFALILVCCYLLVRRWSGAGYVDPGHHDHAPQTASRIPSLAPAIAVLLLAVSPFCYVFSRLAILEPLLILLSLVALLAASAAGKAGALAWRGPADLRSRLTVRSVGPLVALGLLLPLMALTKTTGIFLFPAIFWLLWASTGYRIRPFLAAALLVSAVGVFAWGAYFVPFVRPRYLADYRYLFAANGYTGVTLKTLWPVLQDTVSDGTWIGATLFVLAELAVVGSLASLCSRRFRANPLPATLLLWIFGYAAFLAYHDNLQPRYYVALAVPLTMLVAIVFDALLNSALSTTGRWAVRGLLRLTAAVSATALLLAIFSDARQTIYFVRHPEYTFVDAAEQLSQTIRHEVAAHPGQSSLVLSISGADLSLMTGLPSICDDFGTMTLPDRLAAYHPGWFAAWNDVEDDKMEALAPMYRLVRVAAFPAFDDPDRNLLIVYRLDPLALPGPPGRPGRRRSLSVPRALRTKVGEQPTVLQLKH